MSYLPRCTVIVRPTACMYKCTGLIFSNTIMLKLSDNIEAFLDLTHQPPSKDCSLVFLNTEAAGQDEASVSVYPYSQFLHAT